VILKPIMLVCCIEINVVMLDSTAQRDGRVIGWAVDGLNGVGIGFGKGGKEMEVAG
jgi:hypothetical protein